MDPEDGRFVTHFIIRALNEKDITIREMKLKQEVSVIWLNE